MIYLQIFEKKQVYKKSVIPDFLRKMLCSILPISNPDLVIIQNKITSWYLEFEDDKTPPINEIGLANNQPIIKMPDKKNYGYWLDNNLTVYDFKKIFRYKEINESEFVKKWKELDE